MKPNGKPRHTHGRRETNTATLRPALMRVLDRRIVSKGDISFPCIPALGTQYAEKLCSAWSALGRKFSDTEAAQLRTALTDVLTKGYNITPHATVLVSYEADPPPNAQLRYHLQVVGQTVAE